MPQPPRKHTVLAVKPRRWELTGQAAVTKALELFPYSLVLRRVSGCLQNLQFLVAGGLTPSHRQIKSFGV